MTKQFCTFANFWVQQERENINQDLLFMNHHFGHVLFNYCTFHNFKMNLELVKCRSKWCEKELEGVAYWHISRICVHERLKQVS